jgi:hypothetical protein
MYKENLLERALQETFQTCEFFGFVPHIVQGTKVAVTATSGGNRRTILTNYNGPVALSGKEGMKPIYNLHAQLNYLGYSLVRPDDILHEPLLWQALVSLYMST